MGLHGLKSWDETLNTHDARAHKTISVARYPVRLRESNNILQPCCCKPFLGSDENGCRRRVPAAHGFKPRSAKTRSISGSFQTEISPLERETANLSLSALQANHQTDPLSSGSE